MRLTVSLAAVAAIALGGSGQALAQAPAPSKNPPVFVLTPDSNDADEQAEALASAIRSHVRETAGPGTLGETPSSLDAFQQALRCPSYSDPSCLDKIAAQLHTNRFVWGRLTRGGGKINVTLHYYVKGRADRSQQATYSDNLREANDESLRAVAASLFDQLTGISTVATVRVHVADTGQGVVQGSIYVDGERRARLDRGSAAVTLPLGHHTVEVRATGYDPVRQSFDVQGGENVAFEPRLLATGTTPVDSEGPPTRLIIGYGAIGLGVVAGVVSGLFAAKYASDSSDAKTDRATYSGTANCSDHLSPSAAACNDHSNGTRDSALAWTMGGAGGALIVTGLVVLLTGHSDEGKPKTAGVRDLHLTPSFGGTNGGLSLSGSF